MKKLFKTPSTRALASPPSALAADALAAGAADARTALDAALAPGLPTHSTLFAAAELADAALGARFPRAAWTHPALLGLAALGAADGRLTPAEHATALLADALRDSQPLAAALVRPSKSALARRNRHSFRFCTTVLPFCCFAILLLFVVGALRCALQRAAGSFCAQSPFSLASTDKYRHYNMRSCIVAAN